MTLVESMSSGKRKRVAKHGDLDFDLASDLASNATESSCSKSRKGRFSPKSRGCPKQNLSSFQVFSRFIRLQEGLQDGTGILSAECVKLWLDSRQTKVIHPEESFRRTLIAHIRGAYGRQPFPREVEASLLKILRETVKDGKPVNAWERCFPSNSSNIGKRGFNKLGFHEQIAKGIDPSQKETRKKSIGIKIMIPKKTKGDSQMVLSATSSDGDINVDGRSGSGSPVHDIIPLKNDIMKGSELEHVFMSGEAAFPSSQRSNAQKLEVEADVLNYNWVSTSGDNSWPLNFIEPLAPIPPVNVAFKPSPPFGMVVPENQMQLQQKGSKLLDRIIETFEQFYTPNEIESLEKVSLDHGSQLLSPSIAFFLDEAERNNFSFGIDSPNSNDKIVSWDYLTIAPSEQKFTPGVIGSFILDPKSLTVVAADDAASQILRRNIMKLHVYEVFESCMEFLVSFAGFMPELNRSGVAWTRGKVLSPSFGRIGLLIRYKKCDNGMIMAHFQDQSSSYSFGNSLNSPLFL